MFKWLRKNEQGSVMVIVAISLAALLGFTGLAVDFGGMAMTKQELQNAADAAALAAGVDRINGKTTDTARATAEDYVQVNGYTNGDGQSNVNVEFQGDKVIVTVDTLQSTPFTAILTGKNETSVTARAVAQITSAFGNYDYALFAGEMLDDGGSGLVVNGGGNDSIHIYGDMHSNSYINMSKAILESGKATANGSISFANKTEQNSQESVKLDMPSAQSIIDRVKDVGYWVEGDVSIHKNKYTFAQLIEDAKTKGGQPGADGVIDIYIEGSLTESGGGNSVYHISDYPVNLVVRDSIACKGTALSSEADKPMILISETKNVEVCGGGTGDEGSGFYGIVFAPKGDVTLNGGKQDGTNFYGSIIAQNIRKNGGKFVVKYTNYMDKYLPDGKVRLIE